MERQLMWSPWTGPGLEHLHLRQQQEGIVAGGTPVWRSPLLEAGTAMRALLMGSAGFTAELAVDADGLVLDYPGLFRRVGTW